MNTIRLLSWKPKGSADYHQVLDFLRSSHIRGVEDLPTADIYLGMDNMGYPTEGKLTFHKNKFSPQWRFIVHTIMHCLSTKSGSWDQFGSSLATALICLTEGRKFNWHHHHLDPTTIPASAQENEQGPFSDPNPTSSSRPQHASEPKQFTSTNMEDDVFGGSFDNSPPRSTEAPLQVRRFKELEDKTKREKEEVPNEDDIPPSSSIPSDAFAGGSAIPPDVNTGPTDAPSDKGKSPMLEEEPPLAREREEQKQKRQKDVLESTKYYTDADWNEIIGQVHANQGLSADLLGPDVNKDNFAERMVAIIAERRRKFAAQRSFSDDQLKDEFDKIRHAVANLHSQHLKRSLKRQGTDLEQPDSKKSKSTEPQKTFVPAASRPSSAGVTPDVHQSPFVDTSLAKASSHPDVTPATSKQPSVAPTPPSGFSATPTVTRTSGPRTRNQSSAAGIKTYSTRRKSLGSRKMSSSEVDLNAANKSFIKVLFDDAI
ncbi:hypothetical protein Tco_0523374 [Tanacetum coccineum]